MSQARKIQSGEIVNLITVFSQKQGRIRYRIRLHLSGGENLIFGEFGAYEPYRRAWDRLHKARNEHQDLMIRL